MRQEKALSDRVVEARLAACVLVQQKVCEQAVPLHQRARRHVRLRARVEPDRCVQIEVSDRAPGASKKLGPHLPPARDAEANVRAE